MTNCSLCLSEIKKNEDMVKAMFNVHAITICSDCIEVMAEVIEEYYVYKYNEAERATVH